MTPIQPSPGYLVVAWHATGHDVQWLEGAMTDAQRQAIRKVIERHTALNAASQAVARAALVREGIRTPDGRLAPEYGGSMVAGRSEGEGGSEFLIGASAGEEALRSSRFRGTGLP